jgi:hypothetical protein
VGFRVWFASKLGWLGASSSGTEQDEMCELMTVPASQAPMLVTKLESHGIPAEFVDPNPLSMHSNSAAIRVRRRDLRTASEVVMSEEPDPAESQSDSQR